MLGPDRSGRPRFGVKANADPFVVTHIGLWLLYGSNLEADAVVWCTRLTGRDAQGVAAGTLFLIIWLTILSASHVIQLRAAPAVCHRS